MAADVQSADSSKQVIPSRRKEFQRINEVFIPMDKLDVALSVELCSDMLWSNEQNHFMHYLEVPHKASPLCMHRRQKIIQIKYKSVMKYIH